MPLGRLMHQLLNLLWNTKTEQLSYALAEDDDIGNGISANSVFTMQPTSYFTGCKETWNDLVIRSDHFCVRVDLHAAHRVVDTRSDGDGVVRSC